MNKLRIIFMGTPEFAVPSLKLLTESEFQVVAVVTAVDKPQGRGKKLGISAVKAFAESQSIPVLQPTNLKDPEFIRSLQSYEPDLQVVVAFRMLPEVVWSLPKLGSFNLHASLLPQYRGAAPINWAIINGEKETGVTTFMLDHQIDTGNLLLQEKEPIHADDTAGSLYSRLMEIGAKLVLKTVTMIANGNHQVHPQNETTAIKHAPKLFRETCQINWQQPATHIHNFIRGLNPYPAAWTIWEDKNMKIFESKVSTLPADIQPGQMKSDGKSFLYFGTSDYLLEILELQLEGKKRMKTEDFLRGQQMTISS